MCEERERLIGYVYDECDAIERRTIEAHLASCHGCRVEIGALRGVRQDLLAWDVPDTEAVWRLPVPVGVTSPWRAVPAWALATAASLTLMVGAAGGAATYALLPRPMVAATNAPSVIPTAASASATFTPAALSELENRVLAQMRAEMEQRLRVSAPAIAPAGPATINVSHHDEELATQLSAIRSQQDDLSRAVYGVWAETMGVKSKQSGLEERSNLMLASLVQGQGNAQGFSGGR